MNKKTYVSGLDCLSSSKRETFFAKLSRGYPEINLVEVKNNIEALQMVYDGEVFGYIGAQGAVAFPIQSIDLAQMA